MKEYYEVVVQGSANNSPVTDRCGHHHRTERAAEECKSKLRNFSPDGKRCSARWYGCRVSGPLIDGKYVGADIGWARARDLMDMESTERVTT